MGRRKLKAKITKRLLLLVIAILVVAVIVFGRRGNLPGLSRKKESAGVDDLPLRAPLTAPDASPSALPELPALDSSLPDVPVFEPPKKPKSAQDDSDASDRDAKPKLDDMADQKPAVLPGLPGLPSLPGSETQPAAGPDKEDKEADRRFALPTLPGAGSDRPADRSDPPKPTNARKPLPTLSALPPLGALEGPSSPPKPPAALPQLGDSPEKETAPPSFSFAPSVKKPAGDSQPNTSSDGSMGLPTPGLPENAPAARVAQLPALPVTPLGNSASPQSFPIDQPSPSPPDRLPRPSQLDPFRAPPALGRSTAPPQPAMTQPAVLRNSGTGRPAMPRPRTSDSTGSNRPGTRARQHRIVDGDTLDSISQRYLGSPQHAMEIFKANRQVLQRPDILPLGASLNVPQVEKPTTNDALRANPVVSDPFSSSPALPQQIAPRANPARARSVPRETSVSTPTPRPKPAPTLMENGAEQRIQRDPTMVPVPRG